MSEAVSNRSPQEIASSHRYEENSAFRAYLSVAESADLESGDGKKGPGHGGDPYQAVTDNQAA